MARAEDISLEELLDRCAKGERPLGQRRARTVVLELARLTRGNREALMSELLGRLARKWRRETGLKEEKDA